uniref:Neurobeachin-like protein 2 n=1 Tax=Naja naja TaxID=35670 RepID=A0A8C7DXS6_NAJNA
MLVLRRWCLPASGPTKDPQLLQMTLKSVVSMVHILHTSNPSQRAVKIRDILGSFFKVLNADQPLASLEGSPGPHWEEKLITLRVNMLDAIPEMLNYDDRPVLQAMFLSNDCFEHIIRLIQNSKVFDNSSDTIAIQAIRVLTSIMATSPAAKEVFKERIGYSHLYEVLKSQSQPTKKLLQELLNMAVEGDHTASSPCLIRNEQPLLILTQWIPELTSRDLQIFLSEWLKKICNASLQSLTICVRAGMVGCLLDALSAAQQNLDSKCTENLVDLLQALGSLSIRPGELRQLLKLLRTENGTGCHPYTVQVVRALSGMAHKEGPERALQYFDLMPSMAGIMMPPIQKWPGVGFAFHAWLCLLAEETQDAPEETGRLKRKQLYSFFTASGTGFEAFFTTEGMLVVAVCTKKEYMTVALPEILFNDGAWHCVDVVHIVGRRLFSQNLVNIFVDGQLRKEAQLRFPSLGEAFTSCCIGSAGYRTTTTSTIYSPLSHSPDLEFPPHPFLNRSQSFPASLASHTWTPIPPWESMVSTMIAGTQDTEWGMPTSLEGHLGSVAIFYEALQPAQVKALFLAGPNIASPFKPEGDFGELSSKLLLYYTPQACKSNICLDLSPNHKLDGRLTGHQVVNWDVKDVINCVGGMGALLPLLDQVASQKEESKEIQEIHDLVGPELTSSQSLEKNGVAAFLLLVKNFLCDHQVNQESLVQCHGPAIIGALLQKVSSQLMDMNVLVASQILMEKVAKEGNNFLLHLFYQALLFDFRIWTNSDFAVQLSHIQYLSNIIKDHKQRIRKKYGMQYILDSVRTYYGTYKEKPITTDKLRTVQTSLFSLIKDFFCRNISSDEMQSTMNYLAAVNDENQVCGILEVIQSLQKSSPCQDQLLAFLFEPGNVEVFFSLLIQRKFSDEVRERIFKILYKLLKYEKIHERYKHRLKLKDIGYHGFISYLNDIPVSILFFRYSPNYKDLMAVVYLSHRADLTVRLDICRKLFHLIYSQHDMVKQLAKLAGWQDTLTKLYVKESYESRQHSLSSSANGSDFLKLSEQQLSLERGKELVGSSPSTSELPDLDVFLPLAYEASDHELSEGFSDLSMSPTNQKNKAFQSYAFKSFDSLELASHSSSSNIMDLPGQGEAQPGGPADRVYHPLSPFSNSPFDLGLDLGSSSSAATLESGNQTPLSLSGTPSPLENFKPFPGSRARKSSSLSNVLDETSYQETLCLLTDLCPAPIFSLSLLSRSIEASCSPLPPLISAPPFHSLLEMMMESALTDLKQSTQVPLPSLTQNALKLLHLLQDFLFSEGHNNQVLWSEKVGGWEWWIVILGGRDCNKLQSLAYVKLHGLLQTASAPRKEQACYLLGKLETPLRASLHTKSETFSWLVPIIRALMDQCYDTLQLQQFLPSLPPTNGSPTFYEDFQVFCTHQEWLSFIEKHVQPTMAQFEMDTFAKSHDHMSNFWNSCYDALMSSNQRREKEKAESRRKFQELILEPVMKRAKHENMRHTNMLKQINHHHNTVLQQWLAMQRLLTSQRSVWANQNPPEIYWKLSNVETYSRMRLKLVPNHHYDRHAEASALRDNLGADGLHNPVESLPLAVAKEAKVSEMQDDQLAEEDLSFLDNHLEPKEQSQREKLLISEDCELITIVAVIPGRLEVTTHQIYFYDSNSEKEETEDGIGHDFKRPLAQLRELHLRRYNLRRSALEFFFIDQANYFLNFKKMVRNKVYSTILSLQLPNQIYQGSRSPQDLLKASGLTQKWVCREISNFEYLMQLNTIAGRTYNDLSQYPVFPWILQDYVSETLDLSNPAVFRDLSKPIGVANEKHAKDVKEKYESFEDPTGRTDKFHYGTHYSNAAGVMHYLIRIEPFTTLHIQLQSGRFDCADRQFHSVPAAWQARLENPVDVKELIPEFFYFTDFLDNQNGFDLGSLQISNEKVGDVVLPKWAKSPEDFIHKHRQALESEYVSAHLHEWIDLIFGYKQRGPAAVEALNVFYYCTYEGAVDLDAIPDETQRKALEGFISNFGQTPCQLLKEPHPARFSAENAAKRVSRLDTYSPNIFENLDQLKLFFVEGISDWIPLVQVVVPKSQSHSFITQGSPDMMVTVSANGLLGTHSWLPYDKNISNYFSFTKDSTVSNPKTQRCLYGPFVPGAELSSKMLVVSHDGKLLFSGGHWDNSLRVTSLSKGKVVGHIHRHIDVVTCLALDLCGIYLISGSRDTTCLVWQVLQQGGLSYGLASKPVQVLYGHEDEVTCVGISTELDMAVSGSKDGSILVHTIRRGQFIKSLKPPCESSLPVTISNLVVGHEGQIVVQTIVEGRTPLKDKFALHLYSVNGKHLSSVPLEEQVTSMCVTEDFVVLGTLQCLLQIRDLQRLKLAIPSLIMKVPIHSVSVTKEKSHILVGLEDGKLIVVGAGQPSEVSWCGTPWGSSTFLRLTSWLW